jgi:Ca2+-transporting ATPase
VLTRQPQAVEALGATTVLCVDKTGTLTCNRMAVAAVFDGVDAGDAAEGRFAELLLRIAALGSTREGIEPMDRAILRVVAGSRLPDPSAVQARTGVLPGRPFVTQTWRLAGEADALVAIKGAPEAVLARCADSSARLQVLARQATAWAAEGKRVIAVAFVRCPSGAGHPEAGWSAAGLLAFEDPLRAEVGAAIEECGRAGVRVIMMTGDAAATAEGDRPPGRTDVRWHRPDRCRARCDERGRARARHPPRRRLRRASRRRRSCASCRRCSAVAMSWR